MSQVDTNEVQDMEEVATTISTKAPKAVQKGTKPEGWEITLPNPYAGKSLEQLAEAYGTERVANYAVAQLTVRFQSAVRSLAVAGKSDEEIAKTMETWKPGDRLSSGMSMESIVRSFDSMTPEQQAQLFAMLQSQSKQG